MLRRSIPLFGKAASSLSLFLPQTATSQSSNVIQGNRPPSVGQQGRIHVQSNQVFAAVTQPDYDSFNEALIAKDQIGVANLMMAGRLYLIDNETLVLVLGHGGFLSSLTQVRILEGQSSALLFGCHQNLLLVHRELTTYGPGLQDRSRPGRWRLAHVCQCHW